MSTYIIAEAGVNHNGSLDIAKKLVKVAKEAGADVVKFQTAKLENLVTKNAQQANYQIENLGEQTSQYEMLKKLQLSYDDFAQIKNYCNELKIEFLSTPFDFESVVFLLDTLNLDKLKIPSGELTNLPFLHYIATRQKPIILSTGMATIDEIHEALSFIAFGLAYPTENVFPEKVKSFYKTEKSKETLQHFVTLLHCTTEYPAPFETINLNAMKTMGREFELPIGFSDHSQGISAAIGAVAMGAVVIEKHFTLDRNLEGPDHLASLEPGELKNMVQGIREIEIAMGDGMKQPTEIELKNKIAARKSLVANEKINIGEKFTSENIAMKRPGDGISPSEYWSYIGKTAEKKYEIDDLIDE